MHKKKDENRESDSDGCDGAPRNKSAKHIDLPDYPAPKRGRAEFRFPETLRFFDGSQEKPTAQERCRGYHYDFTVPLEASQSMRLPERYERFTICPAAAAWWPTSAFSEQGLRVRTQS